MEPIVMQMMVPAVKIVIWNVPDLYVVIVNQNAIYPNTVMAGMLVVEIMFIKEMVNLVLSLGGVCPDSA